MEKNFPLVTLYVRGAIATLDYSTEMKASLKVLTRGFWTPVSFFLFLSVEKPNNVLLVGEIVQTRASPNTSRPNHQIIHKKLYLLSLTNKKMNQTVQTHDFKHLALKYAPKGCVLLF